MVDRDPDDGWADYLAAFEAVEQPSLSDARRTWSAIRDATRPKRSRRAWWIGALAAAVLASLAFGRSLVDRPQRVETVPTQQAPYDAESSPERPVTPKREVATAAGTPRESDPEALVGPSPSAGAAVPNESRNDPNEGSSRRRSSAPSRLDSADPVDAAPSTLAEETSAFDEIHLALSSQQFDRALVLIEAHERRFVGSVFRHERTLARARALCGLGRQDEARTLARAFVADHPRSHLAERFSTVCEP